MNALAESTALVSGAFDGWLRAEIRESHEGRNQFLDSYDVARRGFLPTANRDDHQAKTDAHNNRFRLLLGNFTRPSLRDDPYITARLIHHSLMFVSGGFRVQCFLEAGNLEEYLDGRFGVNREIPRASGIEIGLHVGRILGAFTGIATYKEMADHSDGLRLQIFETQERINQWFAENPDRVADKIGRDEEPVQAVLDRQRYGLTLATEHAAFWAGLHGNDFANVPVLEAKSITDVDPEPLPLRSFSPAA